MSGLWGFGGLDTLVFAVASLFLWLSVLLLGNVNRTSNYRLLSKKYRCSVDYNSTYFPGYGYYYYFLKYYLELILCEFFPLNQTDILVFVVFTSSLEVCKSFDQIIMEISPFETNRDLGFSDFYTFTEKCANPLLRSC